jgi:hypothetical protein
LCKELKKAVQADFQKLLSDTSLVYSHELIIQLGPRCCISGGIPRVMEPNGRAEAGAAVAPPHDEARVYGNDMQVDGQTELLSTAREEAGQGMLQQREVHEPAAKPADGVPVEASVGVMWCFPGEGQQMCAIKPDPKVRSKAPKWMPDEGAPFSEVARPDVYVSSACWQRGPEAAAAAATGGRLKPEAAKEVLVRVNGPTRGLTVTGCSNIWNNLPVSDGVCYGCSVLDSYPAGFHPVRTLSNMTVDYGSTADCQPLI